MKNIKTAKDQIAKSNPAKSQLISKLIQKNIKGGLGCPPPIGF
jgi:hypothetical protein